jgi:hypothetical protein
MAERPIILTVFSDVEDPNPLPRLVEERDEMIDLLKTPDQQKRIEHKYLSVKDGVQLMDYIRTYREEILLFHYGGHADNDEILLPDGRSLIKGIAAMFENLHLRNAPLKLVFLNGCATWEQVDVFFNTGVEAVIATRAKVNDTAAKEFALSLYKTLFTEGKTLEQAFNDAVAAVQRISDEIRLEKEPFSRGPKNKRLKKMMEDQEEMPWFLFTRKEEILKSTLLPKKRVSALSLAGESIQNRIEESIKAKKEKIEALKQQIQDKAAEIAAQKVAIEAQEAVPMAEAQKQMILKVLATNLENEQTRLQELKDEVALLTLEVEEAAEGFLHTESLRRLKSALFEINYRDQLRYFIRDVDPVETFRAFILQGNKDCANDLLVHLLLIEINGDDKVAVNKMELDFSIIGNDAPHEGNIWTKVKEHFHIPDEVSEQKSVEMILQHLERGHVIFHFKRMYNNEPQYNLKIIKKFWYTFCRHATAEAPAARYLYKCYLFVSDENCRCQNEEPYVLDRGYKTIIPEQEQINYLLDILEPPIQPILFRELDEWVNKVPRPYRLTEPGKLQQILGGDYGFVLPTIRNYCQETGTEGMKIYDQYFAQYEINQQA